MDLQWVDALDDAVQSLEVPPGGGFIWAASEHRAMARLRQHVLAVPGVDPQRMRIASYWKQGEEGFHEAASVGG